MIGPGLGREVGQQADRGLVARSAAEASISSMLSGVHADDQVEPVEILGQELPRAQVTQVDAALRARRSASGHRADCRCASPMVPALSVIVLRGTGAEHALGRG